MVDYQCLTEAEVETMVNNWVADIANLYAISPSKAKLLLQLNDWNIDLIHEEAGNDKDEFLVKNGLKIKEKPVVEPKRRLGMDLRTKKAEPKKKPTCGVCWEDENELVALDCGHQFCIECWPNYIKAQVEESTFQIF
jgi:ariadne-1